MPTWQLQPPSVRATSAPSSWLRRASRPDRRTSTRCPTEQAPMFSRSCPPTRPLTGPTRSAQDARASCPQGACAGIYPGPSRQSRTSTAARWPPPMTAAPTHGGRLRASWDRLTCRFRVRSGTTFIYPTQQQAGTIWFHDHALGATRLNVFAGMAGLYLITDPANEPAARRAAGISAARHPAHHPGQELRHGGPDLLQPGLEPAAEPDGPPLLDPRVHRRHDPGERQDLALPERRAPASTASASSTAPTPASTTSG